MQQPISPVWPNDHCHAADGFTLLEVTCVLAILALLAAVVLPALPRETSRARLESYAIATAALLKADRNVALRRQMQIATEVDAATRLVRSGSTGRTVQMPDDVTFDALLAARCSHLVVAAAIQFFPSGMSCGGIIALSRPNIGYEVRVNWLTGGIDVVALSRS